MKKYEITFTTIEEGEEVYNSCLCSESNKEKELKRIKKEGATNIKVKEI